MILRNPVIESSLEEVQGEYSDWKEVFGEPGSSCGPGKPDAVPPGAPVDLTPPLRSDVEEILALVNGENDGPDWIGLFRLKDQRILLAYGGCDYTGWD